MVAAVLLWAPAARAVILRASSAVATPGSVVEIVVTFGSGGERVAAIQNDLELSGPLHFVFTADGPDCTVNPDIKKDGAFAVPACTGDGPCGERVRAIILAFDNVDPIADDSELYRCRIAVDADAVEGAYRIAVIDAQAASPAGLPLSTAGLAGVVTVGASAAVNLRVADATLPLGGFTPFGVSLITGNGAAAVTNDIALSWAVHITSDIEDKPHCEALVPNVEATFDFLPSGCSASQDTCTTMRASIRSSAPLPEGTTLYQCTVFPVPVLDPGTYAIDCPLAVAADVSGASLAARCEPGVARVLPYPLPPTFTPTPIDATVPEAPTVIRVTPTWTAALSLASSDAATTTSSSTMSSGGCQVAPPVGTGALLPLLGPALWLAYWRRRRGLHRSSAKA